jgi:FAD/FMN-containing dehydrogenase/Fe-S oxidoreductase
MIMNTSINRTSLESDLKSTVKGEVYFDQKMRGLYSTDASNYRIEPVAVFTPLNEDDVILAVNICRKHKVTVLPRGGGTSLGGQTVGHSLIIDFSKHMNAIVEVNREEKWARVQPGVVRDNLNDVLAKENLLFAPDPATTSRANVGGMIGNNTAGTKSILYGKTVDHVLEVKILLSDGEILHLKNLSPQHYQAQCQISGRHGEILSKVQDIVEPLHDEIKAQYPKVMRNVMGYNLNEFVDTTDWNLAKLFCGSEGTLGTLLEAKVNLVDLPKHAIVCIVHFSTLKEAVKAVEPIVAHGPSAVEILDHDVIHLAQKNLQLAPLCEFFEGDPEAMLIVEFYGDTKKAVDQKVVDLIEDLKSKELGFAYPIRSDGAGMARVWEVRKNGLGIMLGRKGDAKPSPFIEDAAVPLNHLPDYIDLILKYCASLDVPVSMYAHASVGLIHVRPILDLRKQLDIDKMNKIAQRSFELIKSYGGSLCGEHGDGLVRSPFIETFYGPKIYNAFKEIKMLFDPLNLMNPGKIIDSEPMDHHLRYGTEYQPKAMKTEFHYLDDGSFGQAVEMCTGVGACRQTLAGTMCPSFRATRDEADSTRGRANALRLAMAGDWGPDGMQSKALFDTLDLCLSCKACKSECPSNVDVAKLKSEFLQQYRDKHGTTVRDGFIKNSHSMAEKFSGRLSPLINRLQKTILFRKILEKVAKIDSRRILPDFSRELFEKWFNKYDQGNIKYEKKVVLFDDTYIRFHEPQVGVSAVELLNSCGYEVILAKAGCCQRPRISNGFLKLAKEAGLKTIKGLDGYIQEGLKVVVCEPSCASALVDDLPDLIGDRDLRDRIKANVLMIDVFLYEEITAGRLEVKFKPIVDQVIYHGHCHQKALFGTTAMKTLYEKTEGLSCSEIQAGCCGMAGSFGYEKEHYDLSMKIGEDRLFPAIRNDNKKSTVVACGFSCRHQIESGTQVKPVHWVETIRGVINKNK